MPRATQNVVLSSAHTCRAHAAPVHGALEPAPQTCSPRPPGTGGPGNQVTLHHVADRRGSGCLGLSPMCRVL